MADNPGTYPLVSTTPVGAFRLMSGDTQSVPFDPPRTGLQNYTFLSDDEIEQFLAQGHAVNSRAIGYWYLSLAGAAAMQSKSVKDYDLQVDLTKRSEDLRRQAQFYFNLAEADDANAGFSEAFFIVPTGRNASYCYHRAEAAPHRLDWEV